MTQVSEWLAAEASRCGLSGRRLPIETGAGHLRHGDELGVEIGAEEARDLWVRQMLDEFGRVPDEWKPIIGEHSHTFIRLSTLPPGRILPVSFHPSWVHWVRPKWARWVRRSKPAEANKGLPERSGHSPCATAVGNRAERFRRIVSWAE
jgi:hypothetical protein